MEHIVKCHIDTVSHKTKSNFLMGLDVTLLIKRTIQHPLIIRPHGCNPNRCWYFGKSSKVIGFRGTDGARCQWIAVLMDDKDLITAYPVPHPKTMKCMR